MKRVTQRNELNQAVEGKKSVVLFHSTWCPFCRTFRPTFERLTTGSDYEAVEAVIDDEENPLWTDFEIEIVPTVVFFENGRPTRRLDGKPMVGLSEAQLSRALR
jgi:thioredoxin-like negative regulator of GroEL